MKQEPKVSHTRNLMPFPVSDKVDKKIQDNCEKNVMNGLLTENTVLPSVMLT